MWARVYEDPNRPIDKRHRRALELYARMEPSSDIEAGLVSGFSVHGPPPVDRIATEPSTPRSQPQSMHEPKEPPTQRLPPLHPLLATGHHGAPGDDGTQRDLQLKSCTGRRVQKEDEQQHPVVRVLKCFTAQ